MNYDLLVVEIIFPIIEHSDYRKCFSGIEYTKQVWINQ